MEHTDENVGTTPAIEAQREVLRAIAEEIDLEIARIAFNKRLQQSVNYGNLSKDDAEIVAKLRQGIVPASARQGSLYVEKINRVPPTLKAKARPRRKSERR